jgi:hypothetical protein
VIGGLGEDGSMSLTRPFTSITMPSVTVVTTGFGRPNTLSGKAGSNTTSYVTSVSDAPPWRGAAVRAAKTDLQESLAIRDGVLGLRT